MKVILLGTAIFIKNLDSSICIKTKKLYKTRKNKENSSKKQFDTNSIKSMRQKRKISQKNSIKESSAMAVLGGIHNKPYSFIESAGEFFLLPVFFGKR